MLLEDMKLLPGHMALVCLYNIQSAVNTSLMLWLFMYAHHNTPTVNSITILAYASKHAPVHTIIIIKVNTSTHIGVCTQRFRD